jgi:hypothetical protein
VRWQTAPIHANLYYRDPVPWDAITAIGAVLGGLALPIAFIQLGAQRQDQLRAQVNMIGAWTGKLGQRPIEADEREWVIRIVIRNSSDLPVYVDEAFVSIQQLGPDGEYMPSTTGMGYKPRTIAPGDTWTAEDGYRPGGVSPDDKAPQVSITRVIITDAAGRQWEVRPYKAGPPRRVRWLRRWLRQHEVL